MTRVAVTTDRFTEAAVAFARVGLKPVSLPCIRVQAADEGVLAQAREAASIADLVLISSVRTLDVLWPNGSMPALEVGAVGERTAAAVKARGGRVVLLGRSGLADLVERGPTDWLLPGSCFLMPPARIRWLWSALRANLRLPCL